MQLRFGARTANGYTTRMFADAWSRYLPKTVEQWNTINKDGDERHLSGVELDTAGFGTGTAGAHDTHGACSGVPPVAGETGPTRIGDDGAVRDDPPC